MYRIERQHEGPTRGHWLPVKGATYGTREEAKEAVYATVQSELRRPDVIHRTDRFRVVLAAAVAVCLVLQ